MLNVAVYGPTGNMGKKAIHLVDFHPSARILYTYSRTEGGEGDLSLAEAAILTLPHGTTKEYLPELEGMDIIDCTSDHRLDENWVYGLPELNKEVVVGDGQRVI